MLAPRRALRYGALGCPTRCGVIPVPSSSLGRAGHRGSGARGPLRRAALDRGRLLLLDLLARQPLCCLHTNAQQQKPNEPDSSPASGASWNTIFHGWAVFVITASMPLRGLPRCPRDPAVPRGSMTNIYGWIHWRELHLIELIKVIELIEAVGNSCSAAPASLFAFRFDQLWGCAASGSAPPSSSRSICSSAWAFLS